MKQTFGITKTATDCKVYAGNPKESIRCCLWIGVNSCLTWLWTVTRDGRKWASLFFIHDRFAWKNTFPIFPCLLSPETVYSRRILETTTTCAGGGTWAPALLIGWLHPWQMLTWGSHRWRRVTSASSRGGSGFRVGPCVVGEEPSGCWEIDNGKLRGGTCKGTVFSYTGSEGGRVLFCCIATGNWSVGGILLCWGKPAGGPVMLAFMWLFMPLFLWKFGFWSS